MARTRKLRQHGWLVVNVDPHSNPVSPQDWGWGAANVEPTVRRGWFPTTVHDWCRRNCNHSYVASFNGKHVAVAFKSVFDLMKFSNEWNIE